MSKGRRGRSPDSYRRRAPQREPYDVVLIVCEGAKTEPNYFNGLKRAWQLSSTNIKVLSPDATDPPNLVKFAIEQMQAKPYDRAFCVFDRDTHAGFDEARRQIAQSRAGSTGKLKAIVSWPCFEIWVLLHFNMTAKPFTAGSGRWACDNVIREIASHFGGYTKGATDIFRRLENKMEESLNNADVLAKHNRQTGSNNPATDIHSLIQYLQELKPRAS